MEEGARTFTERLNMSSELVLPFLHPCALHLGEDVEFFLTDPECHGEVLHYKEKHEGPCSGFPCVFSTGPEEHWMFYRAISKSWGLASPSEENAPVEYTCVAESSDGLSFRKPHLSLHRFEGSFANNILFQHPASHNFSAAVFGSRLLAVGGVQNRLNRDDGIYLFEGKGPLEWEEKGIVIRSDLVPKSPLDSYFDGVNSLVFDPVGGCYRLYTRDNPDKGLRTIQYLQSRDLTDWSPAVPASFDYAERNVYSLNALRYPSGTVYLGLACLLDGGDKKTKHAGLLFSSDGIAWHSLHEGSWKPGLYDQMHSFASGLIDDAIHSRFLFYLTGVEHELAVKCCSVPRHRIGGVRALHGWIEVDLKHVRSSEVRLNFCCGPEGSIKPELLSVDGEALASGTLLRGDSLGAPVSWEFQSESAEKESGSTRRLRLELSDAAVYSAAYPTSLGGLSK